ncbi:MAG: hypothetical protein NZ822_01215 [Patescibacteria group bacterium]|nr:hypothetical protein [Patescibacteria group bacterium]
MKKAATKKIISGLSRKVIINAKIRLIKGPIIGTNSKSPEKRAIIGA